MGWIFLQGFVATSPTLRSDLLEVQPKWVKRPYMGTRIDRGRRIQGKNQTLFDLLQLNA